MVGRDRRESTIEGSTVGDPMRPEDPARLRAFHQATDELLWDESHVTESLSQLFRAVDDLAEAEVNYYYRRRTTRAWISGVSRSVAWLAGTIGLLLPLLAATKKAEFTDLGLYGFVFIAIAASALAANALFGGTEGHIRFVTTQLELEKLITKTRIAWCQYLRGNGRDREGYEAGFQLIQDYAAELYAITITETGRWGETIMAELAKFQKRIEANNKG